MKQTKPLLKETLPQLVSELKQLLAQANKADLAESVDSLRIIEKCDCDEISCASFYVAPKPDGSYGPKHENVLLDSKKGLLILDVVDGEIVFVEILDRPEYKKTLDFI